MLHTIKYLLKYKKIYTLLILMLTCLINSEEEKKLKVYLIDFQYMGVTSIYFYWH